jgi:hypothetical protein
MSSLGFHPGMGKPLGGVRGETRLVHSAFLLRELVPRVPGACPARAYGVTSNTTPPSTIPAKGWAVPNRLPFESDTKPANGLRCI